jgi:hypothetical protein
MLKKKLVMQLVIFEHYVDLRCGSWYACIWDIAGLRENASFYWECQQGAGPRKEQRHQE